MFDGFVLGVETGAFLSKYREARGLDEVDAVLKEWSEFVSASGADEFDHAALVFRVCQQERIIAILESAAESLFRTVDGYRMMTRYWMEVAGAVPREGVLPS